MRRKKRGADGSNKEGEDRAIVTAMCRWISNGILRDSSLAQVWKNHAPEIHASLFLLLKQFGVLYELDEMGSEHVLNIIKKLYSSLPSTL